MQTKKTEGLPFNVVVEELTDVEMVYVVVVEVVDIQGVHMKAFHLAKIFGIVFRGSSSL